MSFNSTKKTDWNLIEAENYVNNIVGALHTLSRRIRLSNYLINFFLSFLRANGKTFFKHTQKKTTTMSNVNDVTFQSRAISCCNLIGSFSMLHLITSFL